MRWWAAAALLAAAVDRTDGWHLRHFAHTHAYTQWGGAATLPPHPSPLMRLLFWNTPPPAITYTHAAGARAREHLAK